MKATLTFRRFRRKLVLGFRKDEDLRNALDGAKWKEVVYEFDQFLRTEDKYGSKENAYEYREMLRDMISGSNLNLE